MLSTATCRRRLEFNPLGQRRTHPHRRSTRESFTRRFAPEIEFLGGKPCRLPFFQKLSYRTIHFVGLLNSRAPLAGFQPLAPEIEATQIPNFRLFACLLVLFLQRVEFVPSLILVFVFLGLPGDDRTEICAIGVSLIVDGHLRMPTSMAALSPIAGITFSMGNVTWTSTFLSSGNRTIRKFPLIVVEPSSGKLILWPLSSEVTARYCLPVPRDGEVQPGLKVIEVKLLLSRILLGEGGELRELFAIEFDADPFDCPGCGGLTLHFRLL